MEVNFHPQKDDNPPNQYRSVEAEILEQYLSPLSIPRPQGFGSLNDLELVPTAQIHQPTEALVTGGDQQPQSEEHIVVIPEQLIPDPEAAADSLFSEPMRYSGWPSFLENFILGPNQSNQIWRLRLLSGISLYMAAVVGFLISVADLPKAQAPYHYQYQMVMLITSVGAPIVVAAFIVATKGALIRKVFTTKNVCSTQSLCGISAALSHQNLLAQEKIERENRETRMGEHRRRKTKGRSGKTRENAGERGKKETN
ncbi:hypothetical protein FCM35_KLT17300 [Carex littledalei]|uniref:Uncharacterized protein n=1 Tax=Carex littledalei TaxID=544730 RepID=A0A833REN5_9POAL|nr:hypothetical protein FCM35_KLT17300 [Carex littledalei]